MTLIIFSDQFIAELSVTLFIKERLIVDINELSTIFEGYETQEPVKNIAASVAEKMYQTFSTSTKVLRYDKKYNHHFFLYIHIFHIVGVI